MKLNDELLAEVKDALKNHKAVYQIFDNWTFSISTWTDRGNIQIDSLDESINKGYTKAERIGISLDLVNMDSDEVLAKIAYMELVLVSNDSDREYIIASADEYHDSFETIVPILETRDWNEGIGGERMYEEYDSSKTYLAELHTFYVSPSFRNLGIASYLITHLNDILCDQFNEVVYILAMMINPFKNQVDLDDEDVNIKEYMDGCNEDNRCLYETVYRAFTDNGFVSFPGAKENWYYKNMFA